MIEIRRAASDADFACYADVWNAITPSEPITVAETRRRLERQPWRLYLVAEHDERIVGCGFAGRSDSPGRAFLAVRVLRESRGRGIGDAILDKCRPHATELGATTISGRVAANDEGSLQWLVDRGFVEVGRDVELVRELGEEVPSVSQPGIEIKEVTAAEHDAVYGVAVECWPDMPAAEPIPAPAYDDWAQEELRGPVVFGAFDAGRLVGYAALVTRPASPEVLEHGFTAVVRSHRGRGIAGALKGRQLAWASKHGYRRLVTYTQEGNEAMRAINAKLGYLGEPAWILVRREAV
jgi:GNAT superfamily N-acetyltransferase